MKNLKCYVLPVVFLLVSVLNLSSQLSAVNFFGSTFKDDKRNGDFIVEWYSKFLTAMEEPSLYQLTQEKKIHCYRFLWLRTFDDPISLRLSVDPEGTGLITVKVANGSGGYEPGKIITNENVPLTKKQVDDFLVMVQRAHFWELSSTENNSDRVGLDGAQWIFEGAKFRTYHLVDRWSPEKGSFRELALLLIRFSKLNIKNIY